MLVFHNIVNVLWDILDRGDDHVTVIQHILSINRIECPSRNCNSAAMWAPDGIEFVYASLNNLTRANLKVVSILQIDVGMVSGSTSLGIHTLMNINIWLMFVWQIVVSENVWVLYSILVMDFSARYYLRQTQLMTLKSIYGYFQVFFGHVFRVWQLKQRCLTIHEFI